MTATDDAIEAMTEAWVAHVNGFHVSADEAMRVAFAAVPAEVLARVAIDRGAFIAHGRACTHTSTIPGLGVRNTFVSLYRLATDNDQ